MKCITLEKYIKKDIDDDDNKLMLGVLDINIWGSLSIIPEVCYDKNKFCIRIQYDAPLDYITLSRILETINLLTLEFKKPALLTVKKYRRSTFYYICVDK